MRPGHAAWLPTRPTATRWPSGRCARPTPWSPRWWAATASPRWRASSGTAIRRVRGDLACWGDALPAFVRPQPATGRCALPGRRGARRVGAAPRGGCARCRRRSRVVRPVDPGGPATFTLRLAPGTAVITSDWPVASLVTAHLHDDPALAVAAGRVQARAAEYALVWRQGLRPRIAACTPAEAALLQAVLRGRSLLASLNEALRRRYRFRSRSAWLPDAVTQGLVLGTGPLGHIHPLTPRGTTMTSYPSPAARRVPVAAPHRTFWTTPSPWPPCWPAATWPRPSSAPA